MLTKKVEKTDWMPLIITIILAIVAFGMVYYFFVSPFVMPFIPLANPLVNKVVIHGDLPQCGNNTEYKSGYFCQINNVSFYCIIDTIQPDPFVRTNAYCTEVKFV